MCCTEVVAQWASRYRPFLLGILRADPALDYDDLLNDLYVLLLEKNELSIKAIARKYRMRKLGVNWVPEQPNSYWSGWEQGGEEATEIEDDNGASEWSAPVGILAASSQIAEKMHVSRRRAQQIRKNQFAAIAAQVRSMPDINGQMGLFSHAAMSVNGNHDCQHGSII